MNTKKCKALRRLAQAQTIGQPRRGHALQPQKNSRGQVIANGVVNHPKTTRAYYRALKKTARQMGAA